MKNNIPSTHITIKLPPAIGDWTTLQPQNFELEEVNISKIKTINFDNISHKDLRYLLYMHYRFSEILTRKFSDDMDIKVNLHTIKVAQLNYEEFIESHKDKLIQVDFPIGNIGKANMILDWNLADMIINRLTGGTGQLTHADHFSEVELDVLMLQIEEIIPSFLDLWKHIFEFDARSIVPHVGDFVQDPKVALRDSYVSFESSFYFGEFNLVKIVVAYPGRLLKPLLKTKNRLFDPIHHHIFLNSAILSKIKIPIKATLGRTTLKMTDLRSLQAGDIVTLDNKITEPIELQIGDKIKFFSQPGISQNQVRIGVQLIFSEDLIEGPSKIQREPKFIDSQSETELPLTPPALQYTSRQMADPMNILPAAPVSPPMMASPPLVSPPLPPPKPVPVAAMPDPVVLSPPAVEVNAFPEKEAYSNEMAPDENLDVQTPFDSESEFDLNANTAVAEEPQLPDLDLPEEASHDEMGDESDSTEAADALTDDQSSVDDDFDFTDLDDVADEVADNTPEETVSTTEETADSGNTEEDDFSWDDIEDIKS